MWRSDVVELILRIYVDDEKAGGFAFAWGYVVYFTSVYST